MSVIHRKLTIRNYSNLVLLLQTGQKLDTEMVKFQRHNFKNMPDGEFEYLRKMLRPIRWTDETENEDAYKMRADLGKEFFEQFINDYGNEQRTLWGIMKKELTKECWLKLFPRAIHQYYDVSETELKQLVKDNQFDDVLKTFTDKQKTT